MKFSVVAPLALAATAIAAPQWGEWQGNCVSQSTAESLVQGYADVLGHVGNYTATADAILDTNYVEISDSINILAGYPLGGPSFVGKTEYITGIGYAPPVEGIDTLGVFVSCPDRVLWQWNFTGIGSGQIGVKGFNLFTITAANQISTTYLEFNSVAWALNTGYNISVPAGQAPIPYH